MGGGTAAGDVPELTGEREHIGVAEVLGHLRNRQTLGLGQLLAAVFPGASRSGTTILLCLLLGLARPAATEFCFLVGIPTMLAAGGLKIFKAVHHPAVGAPPEQWGMVLLGFIVSAIVSFIAVKWLLRYVQTHTFVIFGWYRIALGAALLILVGTGKL